MKNTEFLKSSLIAHRGMHNKDKGIVENTIKAFRKAMYNNYIIELDIHLTRDNHLVVFHDSNIKRLTGIDKFIKDMSIEEIKKVTLYNTDGHIIELKEVLSLVNGRVPLLIEVKSENNVGILEPILINELKNYNGKYAIQSFSAKSIKWFRDNASDVPRGILIGNIKDINIRNLKRKDNRSVIVNPMLKVDFISIGVKGANLNRVKRLRRKYLVLGWTVRDNETYNELKEYYDNLIVENIL